ncbi:uncharacterized protein LOC109535903 [Dendroctonus ponderosae]|uniref:uncharacterized protein LOC109535903 n=1 Tax=Dendroctonus ponderosae TaxID=77166 RepID=UPI002034C1E3|nr:uncharacterized protein LOC109535903 [Dendroctonus ponderosae]
MDEYQQPSTDQLTCQICDTAFTTPEHKERHLGTKKHKRNLGIARREAIYENSENTIGSKRHRQEDNFESISQVSIFERCDYRGTREPYRQKKGKPYSQDSHTSYVSSVIAYWSVKLMLNPTIENFHIAFNDKSWGSFGDTVVEIQFKALPQKAAFMVRRAVNFQTIGSSNTKTLNSFENGAFSFQDISDKITAIQNERQELDADTQFLVFTTATSSLDAPLKLKYWQNDEQIVVIAKNYSNETNLCLNTAEDNECIYRFFPQNNYYQLPKVSVYAGQKQKKELPNATQDLIANEFGERRMEIANDFIKYITNWTKGTRAGAFKLSKEDVMVKLGQLLLAPFQISPMAKTVQGWY